MKLFVEVNCIGVPNKGIQKIRAIKLMLKFFKMLYLA